MIDDKYFIHLSEEFGKILYKDIKNNIRKLPNYWELYKFLNTNDDYYGVDSFNIQLKHKYNINTLYFIPTIQWIEEHIKLFNELNVKKIVEIGAGDGFVSKCFQKYGIDCIPTDKAINIKRKNPYKINQNGIQVLELTGLQVINKFKPDLVFWCWEPYKSKYSEKIIQSKKCKYLLLIGESIGGCTSSTTIYDKFKYKKLLKYGEWGFQKTTYKSNWNNGLNCIPCEYLFKCRQVIK